MDGLNMNRREGRKTYRVNEIFHSLQGEGFHSGRAMTFVRFSGCNLRCPWCDTKFDVYKEMTAEEIHSEVSRLSVGDDIQRVCFTGGEPVLQMDSELLVLFVSDKWRIHVETNGTVLKDLPWHVVSCVTVSPKSPMTRDQREFWEHVILSNATQAILKVVWDDEDPDQLMRTVDSWGSQPWRRQYLQPLSKDGKTNVDRLLPYLLSHPDWLLSLQVHKILGLK